MANCILAIGTTYKELGKFYLPATFCDKNFLTLVKIFIY
jgi:hypothetical protein